MSSGRPRKRQMGVLFLVGNLRKILEKDNGPDKSKKAILGQTLKV